MGVPQGFSHDWAIRYDRESGIDPVRVVYEHEKLWAARDPEVSDVFDFKLLEKGHKMWNEGEMAMWDVGFKAQDAVLGGRVLPGMKEYRDYMDNIAAGGKGTMEPH